MTRPVYPDDFSPLPVAHIPEAAVNIMVMGVKEGEYSYSGDTLVLNSAGHILVFALVTQAPATCPDAKKHRRVKQ